MNILQVIPYYWPALTFGGPVKVTYELVNELVINNDVTVYTSDAWDGKRRMKASEMLENKGNFKVYYFKNLIYSVAFSHRIYTNFGILTSFIRQSKQYDVIHLNDVFSIPQIILAKLAHLMGIPYIVSTHGVDMTGNIRKMAIKSILYKYFVSGMLKSAKFVIATSGGEAMILKKLGYLNTRIVFNGVKVEKHKDIKSSVTKPFTILYIGRIHKLKGLAFLIDAIKDLQFSIKLKIAGPDDGDKNNLKSMITEYGIKDKVEFLGFVDGKIKENLYKKTDVFVYPSSLEGFSISILEAMEHSLPVIITKECNFPDVAKYNAGYVLENKNLSLQIENAIKELYNNKSKINEMSKNARKLILNKYSINVMARNIEKLYAKT